MRAEKVCVELVDGVKWSYHVASDGTVAIDYPWEGNPYDPTIVKPSGALTIPSRLGGKIVSKINDNAFVECQNITHISIPEGVNTIGCCAFWGCIKLEAVDLPTSIREIHDFAFWDCRHLASIAIPEGIDLIAEGTFSGCSSLCKIKIPESVSVIERSAFYKCRQLESIILPTNIVSLGADSFYECKKLIKLQIPHSVVSIGSGAFKGCSRLGTGVVLVDDCVLTVNGECPTSLVLPEGIRLIADGAFYICVGDCSTITTIELPSSLSSIGPMAFCGCANLLAFKVHHDNYNFTSCSGALCAKNKKKLLQCPCGIKGEFIVPETFDEISDFAFFGCRNLTSIEMPKGLRRIGNFTCSDCDNLQTVTMPTGAELYGDEIFNGCRRRLTVFTKYQYMKSVELGLKNGLSLPLSGAEIVAMKENEQQKESFSIMQLEELAESGDSTAMSKLAYWYVDKDIYRTIDYLAHAAMRLSPVSMTIIARLMLSLSLPGRTMRGKYWTWGVAIMSLASAENSIAERDLKQMSGARVCQINETKFGVNFSKYNAGLQKISIAIDAFMVKLLKHPNDVRSAMEQYSAEHKDIYRAPFVKFDGE